MTRLFLFHSNFQSWQMRSLPTLDPYVFQNKVICYQLGYNPVHKGYFLMISSLAPSYHFRSNMQMFPRNFVLAAQKCFLICHSRKGKVKT